MSYEGSVEGPHDRDEVSPSAAALRRTYSVPRSATPHGRTAFADVVDDYVGKLTQLVEAEARRARAGGHEITADHVAAASAEYERRQRVDPEENLGRRSHLRASSAVALTTGAAGAPMMAAFLNSPWQIALFTIFVVIFMVGVAVWWIESRSR